MKIGLCAINAKYVHTNIALRYFKNKFDIENMELWEMTINDSFSYMTMKLLEKSYDIVVFSCYIWNISTVLKLSEILKKSNPSIKIILGGPEVSYNGEEILASNVFIDYISSGEGEVNLEPLLKMIINDDYKEISKIQGICYRENGQIINNQGFPLLENLDELPFPYSKGELLDKHKIFYYEAVRGCPFNCSYCLSSSFKGVRAVSMDKLKSDLSQFINAEVPLVKFVDRTANYSKSRFIETIQYIQKNSVKTKFHFEIAAHLLDDETIKELSLLRKDLIQLEIGVQSTNSETIQEISRRTDFEKIKYAVRKIIQAGNIHVHLDLIAGLPKEDYESFQKSFNDVYSLAPHCLQLGFLKVLQGSKMREDAVKNNILYSSFPPYEVISTNWLSSQQLVGLKNIDFVVDKFYNSGSFINSLNFLIKHFKGSYFDFYSQLSKFYIEKYNISQNLSLDKLYDILYEFGIEQLESSLLKDLFKELIKFDYVLRAKPTKYPYWYLVDAEKEKVVKGSKYKRYRKMEEHIEAFGIEIISFIKSGFETVEKERCLIAFNYIQNSFCKMNSLEEAICEE